MRTFLITSVASVWQMSKSVIRAFPIILWFYTCSAMAGVYGSENWCEMYWGDNSATAPISVPTIASAVVEEDRITITLNDFPWKVVQRYCNSVLFDHCRGNSWDRYGGGSRIITPIHLTPILTSIDTSHCTARVKPQNNGKSSNYTFAHLPHRSHRSN